MPTVRSWTPSSTGEGQGRRPYPGAPSGPGDVWVPAARAAGLCRRGPGVPQSTVYGVVTFYAFFTTSPGAATASTSAWVPPATSRQHREPEPFRHEMGVGRPDHSGQAVHAGGLPLHRHVQQGAGGDDRQERPRRGEAGRRACHFESVRIAFHRPGSRPATAKAE